MRYITLVDISGASRKNRGHVRPTPSRSSMQSFRRSSVASSTGKILQTVGLQVEMILQLQMRKLEMQREEEAKEKTR